MWLWRTGPSSVIPTKPSWAPTISPSSQAPYTGFPCALSARRRAGTTIRSSPQIRSIRDEAASMSPTVVSGRTSTSSPIGGEVLDQPGHHLGPPGHLGHEDVLLSGVRSTPGRSEAVEGGDAQRGREVPIAGPAHLGCPQVVAQAPQPAVQVLGRRALHGTPV